MMNRETALVVFSGGQDSDVYKRQDCYYSSYTVQKLQNPAFVAC